jgi:O-antigen/teichoic acid export membrane protein
MASLPFQLTRRNVLQSIATLLSGSVVAQGVTALTLLLIARQLGAENYGQYAACLVLAGLTAIVFSLGLDHWLLKEGGRLPRQLGEFFGSVFTLKLVGGIVWLGLISILAFFLNQETYPARLFQLSALTVLLDTLFATALTTFKAGLRNKITSTLEAGSDIAWLLLTLLFIGAGEKRVIVFVSIRALVLAGSLAMALFSARRLVKLSANLAITKRALRESLPFASSDLLALAGMRMDVLIIAFTLGKVATGLYSPAVGLVNAAFLVPAAVYMVMVPVISKLHATDPRQARLTSRRTIVLLVGIGIVMALGFAISAPYLVGLMGASFRGSLRVLQILSIVLLLKSASFAMAAILVVYGQQGRRTVVQALAVLLNTGSNLLIVSSAGIVGVAWVYVLTELFLLIGYGWLVWRYALAGPGLSQPAGLASSQRVERE